MTWWQRLRHRDRLEGELDRELRDHVERQVADHVRAGMSPREARRLARLEFGGLEQIKELCRERAARGGSTMPRATSYTRSGVWRETRPSWRWPSRRWDWASAST